MIQFTKKRCYQKFGSYSYNGGWRYHNFTEDASEVNEEHGNTGYVKKPIGINQAKWHWLNGCFIPLFLS